MNHTRGESTEWEKTGSPHVEWMSVVAVEVIRASRPAANLKPSQGALQRSSDGRHYTKNDSGDKANP
jgi:hypothetical protein